MQRKSPDESARPGDRNLFLLREYRRLLIGSNLIGFSNDRSELPRPEMMRYAFVAIACF